MQGGGVVVGRAGHFRPSGGRVPVAGSTREAYLNSQEIAKSRVHPRNEPSKDLPTKGVVEKHFLNLVSTQL